MWTGEGNTVISPYGSWQTKFLERALKYLERGNFFGRFEAFTSQQIAASLVSNRQWIAVFAITQTELAFEVSAPEGIGGESFTQLGALGFMARSLTPFHQAVPVQYHVNGAGRRRFDHWKFFS